MREGICVEVSAADRARLEAVVADRNSPQKHVWRAGIILATAEGCGTAAIMRRTGMSKPCVWRWQERFWREGVDGLLRDKTRSPASRRLPHGDRRPGGRADAASEPPGEATHWTGRGDGRGDRDRLQLGAADLGGAPAQPAPDPDLQARQGPGVRRQAARHRRALPRTRRRTRSCSRSTRSAMCGWPPARKGMLSFGAAGCLRSCVRPRSRSARTAGPDGFRGSGPQQILGLETLDFSRLPPIRRCNRPRHRSPSLASVRLAAPA